MGVSSIVLSGAVSGAYGQANEIMGVMRDQFLATGIFTQISDNNPANTVQRTIVLKCGSSLHYWKFVASASGAVSQTLLGLDGITTLTSGISSVVLQSTTMRILYGPNAVSWVYNTTSTTLYFAKADDGMWYAFAGTSGFTNSNDAVFTQTWPVYAINVKDLSGQSPLIKMLATLGATWLGTFLALFSISDGLIINGGFYNDGVNNYLCVYLTTGLIGDM